MKIYYNPACSKCRATLALVQEAQIEPELIEYLEAMPNEAELRDVLQKLNARPRDVLRQGEAVWAGLGIDPEDDEAVLKALLAHPVLLERPIVVQGERAVIARPPENVKSLF